MKFKLTLLSFISSISLCAITSPLALAVEKAPRWFEVEVILFKQLGDKKLLKEHFPDEIQLANYDHYFDLLTPYLQPDIASLKQQLSQCEPSNITVNPAEITSDVLEIKSLAEIEALASDELSQELIKQQPEKKPENQSLSSLTTSEMDTFGANNQAVITEETSVQVFEVQTIDDIEPQGLTEQQVILLTAAEQEFADIQFSDKPRYPYFPNKKLCIIVEELSAEELIGEMISPQKLSANSVDSFAVSKVPTTIKGSGLRSDSQPYLISKNSLLLKDVVTRLKWSKNFKPLLHLGWRQIGITRKKSIPFKIFAGEHLEQTYQQALNQQANILAEQEALQIDQQALLSHTKEQINQPSDNSAEMAKQANDGHEINLANEEEIAQQITFSQQQQLVQLKAIFEQLALIDENSLSEQGIEQFLARVENKGIPSADSNTELNNVTPQGKVSKPIQPWLLDGFIKIHLDHYLYITADLNIASETFNNEVNKQTSGNNGLKAINFSQNRRVISGEVHYFDHPYIGMVVQIRRFDPSKADDEAVSQAIR